jgi:hypothetical protein
MIRLDKVRQGKARQGKARQGKVRQHKATHDNTKQHKTYKDIDKGPAFPVTFTHHATHVVSIYRSKKKENKQHVKKQTREKQRQGKHSQTISHIGRKDRRQ